MSARSLDREESNYPSRFTTLNVVYSHRLSGRFQCEIHADVSDTSSDNTVTTTFATKSVVLASDIRLLPPALKGLPNP